MKYRKKNFFSLSSFFISTKMNSELHLEKMGNYDDDDGVFHAISDLGGNFTLT